MRIAMALVSQGCRVSLTGLRVSLTGMGVSLTANHQIRLTGTDQERQNERGAHTGKARNIP